MTHPSAAVPMHVSSFCLSTFLPIFSVQNKFSVYDKAASKPLPESVLGSCEKGMLEYCLREDIHFFPYGALGGLTARRGGRKMNAKVAEKAREKNVSPASSKCHPQILRSPVVYEPKGAFFR